MKPTLNSLRDETNQRFDGLTTEVRTGFREVNARIDRVVLRLDEHIKESVMIHRGFEQRFDAIDRRFDEMDHRFDEMDRRFDKMDRRLDSMIDQFASMLQPYLSRIEKMVNDHENRISALEKERLH